MSPHTHGAHARATHQPPPARQPLRNAEMLGVWHEPPRIRRGTYRRTLWPYIAALLVIVAGLGTYAWTITESRHATATAILARAGQ